MTSATRAERSRKRREAIAQSQGRAVREYTPTGLVVADRAEWRREYKRLQRRKAGAPLRADIAAKAQANREAKAAKIQQQKKNALHDAHVKRYAYVVECRAKYAKRYALNPDAERLRASLAKLSLPDHYVRSQLKSMGIGVEVITPSLIELKRSAMQYRRLANHIKTTLKDHHEAITKHP